MIRRFTSLPLVGGRRWFAATAPIEEPSKFNPGDMVCWIDSGMVQHRILPYEQENLGAHNVMPVNPRKNWYNQIFGTVKSIDEKTKLVTVNFDQNGRGAYATGTWEVEENMLQRMDSTIHDVPMFTHDGNPFDTEVLKDKVVLLLDMEDRQMPKATSWLKLKRMYLDFKKRAPRDEIVILFFPHWHNDQPAEWFSEQLGLPLEESVYVMKKAWCNGKDTQPVYSFLKQFHPGRVDWRYTQAGSSTIGWHGVKWVLDRKGRVAEKILGGSWGKAMLVIDDVLKRDVAFQAPKPTSLGSVLNMIDEPQTRGQGLGWS